MKRNISRNICHEECKDDPCIAKNIGGTIEKFRHSVREKHPVEKMKRSRWRWRWRCQISSSKSTKKEELIREK